MEETRLPQPLNLLLKDRLGIEEEREVEDEDEHEDEHEDEELNR